MQALEPFHVLVGAFSMCVFVFAVCLFACVCVCMYVCVDKVIGEVLAGGRELVLAQCDQTTFSFFVGSVSEFVLERL